MITKYVQMIRELFTADSLRSARADLSLAVSNEDFSDMLGIGAGNAPSGFTATYVPKNITSATRPIYHGQ
jgi:hypothetical protein